MTQIEIAQEAAELSLRLQAARHRAAEIKSALKIIRASELTDDLIAKRQSLLDEEAIIFCGPQSIKIMDMRLNRLNRALGLS